MSSKFTAALSAALVSLIVLGGCSGVGGMNPSPILIPPPQSSGSSGGGPAITPTQNPNPTRSASLIASPSQSSYLLMGYIDQVRPSEFHLNGGAGIGYIWVHTNGSTRTAYNGLTPKAGLYVIATATGSPSASLTALYAALYTSPPPTETINGELTSSQPYGYAIRMSNDGRYVPLALSSTTSVSGAVSFWTPVTASVTGSEATGFLARTLVVSSPKPTPPPGGAPNHLLTADYLEGLYGTYSVTPERAAPYLTWAQTTINDANGIAAAGIKTQIYVDPNWMDSGNTMYPEVTSADYSRTCSGALVAVNFYSTGTRYDMNPNYSGTHSAFATWVNRERAAGHIDMLYEDNAGPLSQYASYPNGMPCNYSDGAWVSGAIAMDNAVSVPVMINGLNSFDDSNVSSRNLPIMSGSNTVAGSMEGCYDDLSQAIETGTSWQIMENTELAVTNMGKIYECMARNQGTASGMTQARLFTLASFLLSYNPSKSILAEEFYTPSRLHVFPESGLVALNPRTPTPSSYTSLRQPDGAYGREYGACYYRGTYVGACAVAVSREEGLTPAFPFPGYTRTLVLSGDGVLDGGTASMNGPAPGYMPDGTGIIAFR